MKYENANSVSTYLNAIPKERKSQLQKIRSMIKEVAPNAKEEFNYNMLYYPLEGPLFALASQKHFMALYITYHDLVLNYKPHLGKASFGKSCVRFKNISDLNIDALRSLAEEAYKKRMEEIG